jgi:Holliday junction resolvase RusA-like endonuclease
MDRILFPITPKAAPRQQRRDKLLFRIPEVCIKIEGGPCDDFIRDGGCKHALNKDGRRRKKMLLRYFQYKDDLRAMATAVNFQLPQMGFALYFFIPIPRTISLKRRKILHGQHHHLKPDIDNLEKGFYDALSITDETVGQLSGHGKFWIDTLYVDEQGDKKIRPGYIEVKLNQPVNNPFEVKFLDIKDIRKDERRKWVKDESKPDGRKNRKPKPLKIIDHDKIK